MGGGVWPSGTQTFVVHNAPIYDGGDESSTTATACAMLLDAPVVPLLPFPLQPPPPSPDPPYFFIGDAGHKGAGMFAARDIPAGALILVDRPAVIVPSNVRTREVVDALLPRLSQTSRERLLALANCKPLTEYPVVEGIALTNAVQVELPVPPDAPPQEYGAVFPLICRANHSCGLDVSVKWDPVSFSVSMYALRAFRRGEEILNQYIDVLAPRSARQAQLARYGFTCTCASCAVSDVEAEASDAARAELRSWDSLQLRFEPWAADICRADDMLLSSHARALALCSQEGMHGLRVLFLDDCARAHALLGNADGFRTYAEEVVQLCEGLDPERAQMFSRWIEDPSTYEGWGSRARDRILAEKRKEREPDPNDLDIYVPW